MVERRQFIRVSAKLSVRLVLDDEETVTYPAVFARDVSTGGLGIEIAGRYPDSFEKIRAWRGPLRVEMDLPPTSSWPEGKTIAAPAEVVWTRVEGEGDERRFRVGLRFLEMDELTMGRLADFVKMKADELARQKPKGG